MAAKKRKTTKTIKSTIPIESAGISKKEVPMEKQEKEYSYRELADLFGISKLKARAYYNMCGLNYDTKITIKKARELFKRF